MDEWRATEQAELCVVGRNVRAAADGPLQRRLRRSLHRHCRMRRCQLDLR